jgi:formylglycine-generating enzyme required for sulfatase activity
MHVIELVADRFETWRREIEIVAEQPVTFTDIVLEPAKGTVLVQTSPPGAQVVVDGAYAGPSPVEVDVPPDRDLLVQVARDGYAPDTRTVRVAPLERTTVDFDLALQTGTVRLVVTPPDAQLSVDGTPWGEPTTELTLPAMEHRLEFTKEGYIPEVRMVRPRPDVPERVVVELARVEPEASEAPKNTAAANGYALVLVEPGPFTMGASRREQGRRSNETLRNVRLVRPFLIGEREVTNEEYRAFAPNHDSGLAGTVPLGSPQRPVVQVSWDDAARFCNWLSAQDGLPPAYEDKSGVMRAVDPMTTGYRLPTEAEWEYTARVTGNGDPLKYPWGESYPPRAAVGNFADASSSSILNRRIPDYDDGFAGTAPVASFPADDRGLYAVGGNVAEWCHDFYSTYTYDATRIEVDPMGPEAGQHHVVRGASWRHSSISTLRCSYRDYCAAARDDLGFRICRYLNSPESVDEK